MLKLSSKILLPSLLGLVSISSAHLPATPEYKTNLRNLAPIITAILHSTGPTLELGCSNHTTAQIHALCSRSKHKVITVESDIHWFDLYCDLQTDWHDIKLIEPFDLEFAANGHSWGTVLIGNNSEIQQLQELRQFRYNAEIIVLQCSAEFIAAYTDLLDSFKYQIREPFNIDYNCATVILSNSVELKNIFGVEYHA
jgi:hypothetical protein